MRSRAVAKPASGAALVIETVAVSNLGGRTQTIQLMISAAPTPASLFCSRNLEDVEVFDFVGSTPQENVREFRPRVAVPAGDVLCAFPEEPSGSSVHVTVTGYNVAAAAVSPLP